MNEVLRTAVAGGVGALVATTVLAGQPALAGQVGKAAAAQVTSAMIKDGTIKPKDLNGKVKKSLANANTALQSIPDDSVTNSKLANNAVTNLKIADGSVFAAEVATNAVGADELADNAAGAGEVAADAVGASELANDAVGSGEISAGAVGASELAGNSVTGGAVVNGSLALADIADATGTVVLDFPIIGSGACAQSGTIATGVDLDNAIVLVENEVTVAGAVQIHARQAQPGFTSFVVIACNLGGPYDPPSATLSWAVLGGF